MGKKGAAVAEAAWIERREPWIQRRDDIRSPYACDLERVLHSRSFRGLQGKTQVLSPNREGLHRTRLTHSLEVAQTAVEIMHRVAGDIEQGERDDATIECLEHLPPSDLVRTIAMAHDLGHPPFGHDGERALNACMAPYCGFEANGQTLRILARLEASSRGASANLTRRAMLGVLKYPAPASRLGGADVGPAKGTTTAKETSSTGSWNRCRITTARPSRASTRGMGGTAPFTSPSTAASWTSPTTSPTACTTSRTRWRPA